VRTRGGMSLMSRLSAPQDQEPALLAAPGRDTAVTAVVVLATATVFAAVANHDSLAYIQRLDDDWLRLMISGRSAPLTATAMVFNVLGLVYITLPVRIAIAVYLAVRRKWWHLAAFVAAVVMSEILIGTLKGIYDRARPPGSLVATSGASFPSGHAIAASVTVVAAVIALAPPDRRRAGWGAVAVAFSILMACSRAYLGAHWLSDAVAGVLLGTACALLSALVAGQFQRRRGRRVQADGPRETADPPPGAAIGHKDGSVACTDDQHARRAASARSRAAAARPRPDRPGVRAAT
jgi:membrane-associated phospholipid phosphatase